MHSVHSWQDGVNRADVSELALERQFGFKNGDQIIVPIY